jgi:hypothetical protein
VQGANARKANHHVGDRIDPAVISGSPTAPTEFAIPLRNDPMVTYSLNAQLVINLHADNP